ncbi:hypothetical protein VUJ46_20080 [Chryseobacterium sp. MYb264]|uniref:hypothetical protein n=1 Tax=Chryseobacterium sp. MYb264 TaxID=2745153 RepID=UPI002E14EB5B|nr:hypothetical protein VUJ46_20080 [Chryseobacterium sp. MYb264]
MIIINMKKILICICLSIFMQCHTQKIDNLLPRVDEKFEKFDIESFNKNSVRGYVLIQKENTISIQEIQSFGFIERQYNANSIFKKNIFFYKNGYIKKKGILFSEGSQIGIWYYFDESGKLIKEEDTDSGYLFKPEDIIKYCKKNNIELSKGYHERDGYQTSIYKNEVDGKKVWLISYINSLNKQDKEIKLTLDGQTGKVVKREEFPYDNY